MLVHSRVTPALISPILVYSGAPEAWRAAKQSPIPHRKLKETHELSPIPHRKLKETHELIFSWLSWLRVLLVGSYTQRRWQWSHAGWRPSSKIFINNKLTEKCSFGLPCTFWYTCMTSWYDQLTPVKSSYPLISTTWPYRWLKFIAHWGCVLLKLTADQVLVFDWIAGSCQVELLNTELGCSEARFKLK